MEATVVCAGGRHRYYESEIARKRAKESVQGSASRKNVLIPSTSDVRENILTMLTRALVSVLTLEKQRACREENSV
jgi:hypothetical protein